MHVQRTIPYCIYTRLPEDEPSCSKHVEDTKKLKIKILIYEMCISLVYIVQSYYSAQCKKQLNIVLFAGVSEPTPKLIQPPLRWVPRFFPGRQAAAA